MSWINCTNLELSIYLRGLVEGYLATSCSITNVSVPSRLITIANKSWLHGKKTGVFPGFQFLMMPEHLMAQHGAASSTSCVQDSHASLLALQESVKERMTAVTFGHIPYASLEKSNQDSVSWRMFQGYSTKTRHKEKHPTCGLSLKSFPRRGIIVNGILYQRPKRERHTGETDCGLWVGTPKANSTARSPEFRKGRTPNPQEFVQTFPTPNTLDGAGKGRMNPNANVRKWGGVNSLGGMAETGLWPTPNAAEDQAEKYTPETSYKHFKEGRQVHLSQCVRDKRMFPTPNASEPGWKVDGTVEVVDKDGNPPEHPNQRFYDKKTGRVVQKGLTQVVEMWPTPTTINRNSRNAIILKGDAHQNHGKALGLKQVVELAEGILPKEIETPDEIPKKWRKMWPTPRASEWKGCGPKGSTSQKHMLDKKYFSATVVEREEYPTPTTRDWKSGNTSQATRDKNSRPLNEVVMFPTPKASMHEDCPSERRRHTPDLPAVVNMFPTPQSRDYRGAGTPEGYDNRRTKKHQRSLNEEVVHQSPFPTPRTKHLCGGSGSQEMLQKKLSEGEINQEEYQEMRSGGQLNPDWVEWLMGWPVGWTSLEPLSTERFDVWFDGNNWWQNEPEDVPRVVNNMAHRVSRLKAIGNGQVSIVVVLAWNVLMHEKVVKGLSL